MNMTGYGGSRWQEECFGHCGTCSSCLSLDNNNGDNEYSKRFVTLGSVRYGIRLGAVSPPPPGAGPRYRSRCCWSSTLVPSAASEIPLLATTPINSSDIFNSVNKIRMVENTTSDSNDQATTVRDQVLETTKSLLKGQFKRRALIKPQVYSRLCDCADLDKPDLLNTTLDRLPRFRFGGNRANNNHKERDKRHNEQRLRELAERFKKDNAAQQTPAEQSEPHVTVPFRSASFSQVDYSPDNKQYVRRRYLDQNATQTSADRMALTLPRSKSYQNKTTLPEAPDPAQPDTPPNDLTERKRDKSRRRKGMYISQWPTNTYHHQEEPDFETNPVLSHSDGPQSPPQLEDAHQDAKPSHQNCEDLKTTPSKTFLLARADSLSENENDAKQDLLVPSDVSDCESRNSAGPNDLPTRCYSKRPLRGPYGQMLEAEMKKPETRKNQYSTDLKFLEDLTSSTEPVHQSSILSSNSVGAGDPKPKYIARIRGTSNHSLDDFNMKKLQYFTRRKASVDSMSVSANADFESHLFVSHQRTTSSPSKLGVTTPEVSSQLLQQLLQGCSEQLATADAHLQRNNDTRTHVVVELYETERSYVESLQILVTKYLEPLKSQENANLLDITLVDEIFFQIPSLLSYHKAFLEELKKRLEHWDIKQKVGDIFLDTFSRPTVIESYTTYVNNWKRARDIIKTAQQSKPAFAKFLEATSREHKGKLALDSLLIKPIQKFPKYELLLQRLIKHTDSSHPDYCLLLSAQKEVHEQLLKINCTEKEALELEQLREIEGLIEGLMELVATDRQYLRHDLVNMTAGSGTKKERALFLFSDLLLVTSIKRRSGTIRKPVQGSITGALDANKYKLLMKISLDNLEIVKAKDESLRQTMLEIENLTEDIAVLNQINELVWSLHCNHSNLDEICKDMLDKLNKQLMEQQNSDSQLSCLDLILNTSNGIENVSIIFSKPEKRASWEESFNEAKHKLAMSGDRRPTPELIATVPIRKTRAGLQFTCAAPAMTQNIRDVWVCNSDGYVGQVCILTLQPEPTVTSCNGVCNARILCIASVPGANSILIVNNKAAPEKKEERTTIQFDSSSSSDDDERSDAEELIEPSRSSLSVKTAETASIDSDDSDNHQSTMWLGTEDGFIHVYNSTDNIRIKKNKIKLQHGSSILSIIYLDNRVYVSLANGDIIIYEREAGGWNITSPITVSIGSTTMPVLKMLPNTNKLWCGCGNTIKVFNTETLQTENSFTVNNDANKPITCIILSGYGLWLSLQNSAIVQCFHAMSFDLLCEVNVAPAVTKMLTSCDDIIRQHKAACLRITSLLACKEMLWIGTSAGVLLTMPLPHITSTTTKLNVIPSVFGVPHGHTGHVRFLTHIEYNSSMVESTYKRFSFKGKTEQRSNSKFLVISGGDGYEDFRSSNISEVAGREDSTNHLLLWNI